MLILLNKPYGTLCQFSGEGETLASCVDVPEVYPAGRLDKDSEGLLALTDDGQLQARISSPKTKLPKTYLAQVEGEIDGPALVALRTRVDLKDGHARARTSRRIPEPDWLWPRDPPVRYRASIPTSWVELSLDEGRNRQVRRMTAAVGFPTLRLIRIGIGPWSLDGLAPGQWRRADPADLGPIRRPRNAGRRS